jgi:hypothetical protein
MADTTDDDAQFFFSTSYMAYVYVFWRQATPSPSEIAALHRIDPTFRGQSLAEVMACLEDEDYWRLGPFATDNEADSVNEQLRACACFFSAQKKVGAIATA